MRGPGGAAVINMRPEGSMILPAITLAVRARPAGVPLPFLLGRATEPLV